MKKVHDLRFKNHEHEALKEELNFLRSNLESDQNSGASQLKKALINVQDLLKQSEKMAALGMNLASITHEIKNPVGFITNGIVGLKASVNELMEHVVPNEETAELQEEIKFLIDDIEEGAVRTGQIAKSMGVVSREDDHMESADLNDLIRSTLVLLKHKTKHRIEIITRYEKHLHHIQCYPGKLCQVFMNIINNAIQAIPADCKHGKITITSSNTESGVCINVVDNGVGMNEKVLQNLFKPLFTTKSKDEGTGLGMSISKEIIELHHGNIEVKSKPGEGTTFQLYFNS
ncbi:MAG: HAMP domain-containing sensor histidine kinase [Bacteroidota bacterium]